MKKELPINAKLKEINAIEKLRKLNPKQKAMLILEERLKRMGLMLDDKDNFHFFTFDDSDTTVEE